MFFINYKLSFLFYFSLFTFGQFTAYISTIYSLDMNCFNFIKNWKNGLNLLTGVLIVLMFICSAASVYSPVVFMSHYVSPIKNRQKKVLEAYITYPTSAYLSGCYALLLFTASPAGCFWLFLHYKPCTAHKNFCHTLF